jgi:2-iminobutanoate/2-iminopropanoate deaminase
MIHLENPSSVAPPVGSYSHVARVGAGSELIFLSGQVGIKPDGSTALAHADQADQAFANIMALLASQGCKPSDIVKLMLFVVAGHDVAAVRAAREKHLLGHRPASTLLVVSALADPQWSIEVEAVAARPAR